MSWRFQSLMGFSLCHCTLGYTLVSIATSNFLHFRPALPLSYPESLPFRCCLPVQPFKANVLSQVFIPMFRKESLVDFVRKANVIPSSDAGQRYGCVERCQFPMRRFAYVNGARMKSEIRPVKCWYDKKRRAKSPTYDDSTGTVAYAQCRYLCCLPFGCLYVVVLWVQLGIESQGNGANIVNICIKVNEGLQW